MPITKFDTPGIVHGTVRDFTAHKILVAANIYRSERPEESDAQPVSKITAVVGVFTAPGGSKAQARALGLLP